LCVRQRLWGKARSYIEASLSVEETFNATMALARLLDDMGDQAARRFYHRSLELAQALLEQRLTGAAGIAVPGERRVMRLPAPSQA
jgi:uncharacterized protein HemY